MKTSRNVKYLGLWMTTGLVSLTLLGCGSAPKRPAQLDRGDYSYTREYMSWFIRKKMVKNNIVGLSVALIDDQEVIWAEGFGWSDKENKLKATADTVYQTGSITKLFTTFAAMQLAEQGRLDIDAPLSQAIAGLSIRSRFPDTGSVTPRNIMTHHSGLPSGHINGMWTRGSVPLSLIPARPHEEYLAHAPNSVHVYSNVGMSLLGDAVEAISKQPYKEYIFQTLLSPLGMLNSYIADKPAENLLTSKAYIDGKSVEFLYLRDLPAGGLNSSVADMARFARMLFSNGHSGKRQIVQAETLQEMLRYQDGDATFDLQANMGLGWFIDKHLGQEAGLIASHSGSTLVHESLFSIMPDHKLGVVVLANSSGSFEAVSDIANEILKLALETKTGVLPRRISKAPGQIVAADAEALKSIPGRYSTQFGQVTIEASNDRFKMAVEDETLELARRENGFYYLRYKLLGIPIKLANLDSTGFSFATVAGHQLLLTHENGSTNLSGEKILPYDIPAEWVQRVGRYEPINSKGGIELKAFEVWLEDDILMARGEVNSPYGQINDNTETSVALIPINTLEAVVHGLWRGTGDSVTVVERNGEWLLSYSGYLMRRVSTGDQ